MLAYWNLLGPPYGPHMTHGLQLQFEEIYSNDTQGVTTCFSVTKVHLKNVNSRALFPPIEPESLGWRAWESTFLTRFPGDSYAQLRTVATEQWLSI